MARTAAAATVTQSASSRARSRNGARSAASRAASSGWVAAAWVTVATSPARSANTHAIACSGVSNPAGTAAALGGQRGEPPLGQVGGVPVVVQDPGEPGRALVGGEVFGGVEADQVVHPPPRPLPRLGGGELVEQMRPAQPPQPGPGLRLGLLGQHRSHPEPDIRPRRGRQQANSCAVAGSRRR